MTIIIIHIARTSGVPSIPGLEEDQVVSDHVGDRCNGNKVLRKYLYIS